MEKKIFITNKIKNNKSEQTLLNTSFENNMPHCSPKRSSNNNHVNRMEKKQNNNNKISNGIIVDSKNRNYKSPNNYIKNNPIKIINLDNNINNYVVDDNDGINPKDNEKKYNSIFTSPNADDKTRNTKFIFRNNSTGNTPSKKMVNSNYNNNLDNIIFSNTNNIMLIDKNIYNSERLDVRNVIKINKNKDDYIEFLQKEFEDKSKNNIILDVNNKELIKRCNELILNNRLLNETLNDRNTKLNKIAQENINIKNEYDKSMVNYKKMEQKMKLYEDQLSLFKSNNENYQKIIKELKQQNEILNLNMTKVKNEYEEEQKLAEQKYRNEIEDIKKNMEELYNNKIQGDNMNENKIKNLLEEIKLLKEKIKELDDELQKKENVIQLMYKDNEKLNQQNNLNNIQMKQNTRKINEMKIMIKYKDNLINTFKVKDDTEKIILNKSNSCSFMKFDNNETLGENLTKLLNDNEENRLKIELLNDKLKSIEEIKKKYNSLVKDNKTLPVKTKNSFNLTNAINISISKDKVNNTYNSFKNKNTSPKKYDLKNLDTNYINNVEINKDISTIYDKKKSFMTSTSVSFNSTNNIKNETNNRNTPDFSYKNKNDKNIRTYFIEAEKDKKNKTPNRMNAIDNNYTLSKGRNFYKRGESENRVFEKTFFEYKDKNGIILNEYKELKLNLNKQNQTLVNKKEGNNINGISYYLYGIDRNDFFHIFDINNKVWVEKKKIFDINLDDKSNSFKKDYQYEGTILYNTLEGVYILTGDKTDTLYYFNSKLNSISKICKFNNSHNNGSMMYDTIKNCLYVFGGKKSTSCEYYSLSDKKIYQLPDLISDRANSSFIISNNKIYGFFGFSYDKDTYVKTIEYIDYIKKDKWIELNNIGLLKNNISFDIESVSTMYHKQNANQILIYSGIQGDDEDFITEYYLLYDVKNNTMNKINKWNLKQYKYMDNSWKNYEIKSGDPKGFHFAKNSRFILMPKNCIPEGYNENDKIDILIDYKNNVHFIVQDKKKIDIYRGEI